MFGKIAVFVVREISKPALESLGKQVGEAIGKRLAKQIDKPTQKESEANEMTKTLVWFLNFFVLQWFCVRLLSFTEKRWVKSPVVVIRSDGTHVAGYGHDWQDRVRFRLVRWAVPLTGWKSGVPRVFG